MVYFFCQFWSTSSVLCQFLSFISVDLLMAFVSFGLLLFFVSFGLILMFLKFWSISSVRQFLVYFCSLSVLAYFFRFSSVLVYCCSSSVLLFLVLPLVLVYFVFFVSFGLFLFFVSYGLFCCCCLRQFWSTLSVSIQFDLQPLPLSNVGLITWSSPRPGIFLHGRVEWFLEINERRQRSRNKSKLESEGRHSKT